MSDDEIKEIIIKFPLLFEGIDIDSIVQVCRLVAISAEIKELKRFQKKSP